MRSVIIGGGVAGCAVAAALRGSNVASESVILERRLPGAPNGMGFILMPNGIQALESIAPEFDWRSAGQTIDHVSLRSRSGAIFAETPIESAVCVSRERFLEMLRAAANQTQFIDGASMAGLDQHADKSTRAVRLQDGSVIEGDVFFACDGARSRTREILFPEAKLSDVAVQEIVSVADAPALARSLGTTFRKFHDEEGGLAVGMLAESATRVVWFMQFDATRTSRCRISGPRAICPRWLRSRIAISRSSATLRMRVYPSQVKVRTVHSWTQHCLRSFSQSRSLHRTSTQRSPVTQRFADHIISACLTRAADCARNSSRRSDAALHAFHSSRKMRRERDATHTSRSRLA